MRRDGLPASYDFTLTSQSLSRRQNPRPPKSNGTRNGGVANTLNSLKLLDRIPKENFADNLDEAKRIIKPMLL